MLEGWHHVTSASWCQVFGCGSCYGVRRSVLGVRCWVLGVRC